jgi:predicted amidohydrolase
MKDTIRLALIQGKPYPELGDPRNVGHAMMLLEQCRGKKVDVACLPEYFPWVGEEILSEMARKLGCYIVASLLEVVGNDRFNTAILLDRRGRMVGRQRKVHLTSLEKRFLGVRPGEDGYRVLDADFGRIGLAVGIDFWGQPEAARSLTKQDADIIINQTTFLNLRGHWKQSGLVRAFDNFIPVVGINTAAFNSRIGERVYHHHGGHSIIIQPPRVTSSDDFRVWLRGLDTLEAWVTLELDQREQVCFGEIDLTTTRRFRKEFRRHFGMTE